MALSSSKHKKRTPYQKASDEEKVVRNWRKTLGLLARDEFSVAVLRGAICIELAVNFAIRQELVAKHGLPASFVDRLLRDANGLHNKFNKLLLPIVEDEPRKAELTKLWKKQIVPVNQRRNTVAHSGSFLTRPTAEQVARDAFDAIKGILHHYGFGESLKAPPNRGTEKD